MRIELVEKKSIGEASAVYIIGYRLGAIFLSQVITFYIADAFGWSMAYFVIGSIFILSSIFLIFALPEPTRFEISYISIIKNPGLWFKDSFYLAFVRFNFAVQRTFITFVISYFHLQIK